MIVRTAATMSSQRAMDFIGVAVGQYTTPYLVEGGDHEKVRTVHSPPRNCTGTISQRPSHKAGEV
jgi:hypothetical protein